MSPLLLVVLILKVAVAVNLDDLSPAVQAKLEAAILAKYNVNLNDQPKQSSNINGPAPSEPTEAQGFSLKDAPFEVADLETAVLAKYSMENRAEKHSPADRQTLSSSQELDEAAVLEKWKREDSGLNVRRLEDSSKEASSDEALLEKWKREDSGLNVRKLEDSSKEASSDEALLEKWKREDSGLNVRRLEDSSKEASSDQALLEKWKREDSGLNVRRLEDSSKEASSDEALLAKWKREDSGLNVRKLEDSSKEASSDEALLEKWKREDSSQQASSDDQAGAQPGASQETSSSEPATSSKLILKKPSNVTAEDGVAVSMNSSEASATEVATSSNETAAPSSKPKSSSKHYRNHGAGMYHVETAKPVKRLPDQADNAESAAKLAAKRAEVEEIFHLSKKGKQSFRDAQEAPPTIVFSLLRCSFFVAAVLSIAGFACHKYQVILEISNRKGDNLLKRSFKAKQEDDNDPFTDSSPFGQSTSSSIISSVMAGGRQHLSSRSGSNAMSSYEFGV